jgi:hypothetical protein
MDEQSCGVATTPSPVPTVSAGPSVSGAADVFPSPPRSQPQQQQQPSTQSATTSVATIGQQPNAAVRIVGRNVNGTGKYLRYRRLPALRIAERDSGRQFHIIIYT